VIGLKDYLFLMSSIAAHVPKPQSIAARNVYVWLGKKPDSPVMFIANGSHKDTNNAMAGTSLRFFMVN